MSRTRRRSAYEPRRRARRRVLQALYQWQINAQPAGEIIRQFTEEQDFTGVDHDYFDSLVRRITAEPARYDDIIAPCLQRRAEDLDQMERAILRIAACELLEHPETPYRVVEDSTVQQDVQYLSALEEERLNIAQANAPIDEQGHYVNETISARKAGEFQMLPSGEVQMMDVSPNQLVSVAASLIPFLENDDANRALMGSNMQRQAVPLIKAVPAWSPSWRGTPALRWSPSGTARSSPWTPRAS